MSPVAEMFTVLSIGPQFAAVVADETTTRYDAPDAIVARVQDSTSVGLSVHAEPPVKPGPNPWLVMLQLRPFAVGRLSESDTLLATPGPLFVMVIVNTAFEPAEIVPGLVDSLSGVLTTDTSGQLTAVDAELEPEPASVEVKLAVLL
jgi:hypothetical protein